MGLIHNCETLSFPYHLHKLETRKYHKFNAAEGLHPYYSGMEEFQRYIVQQLMISLGCMCLPQEQFEMEQFFLKLQTL